MSREKEAPKDVAIAAPEPVASAAADKIDPERLVTRSEPDLVVRLRKPLVIGLSGSAVAALGICGWFAFSHHATAISVASSEMSQPAHPGSGTFAKAPKTYGDVPKLGPPLPGDLGKPILERQRALAMEGARAEPLPSGDSARSSAVASAEEQRLAQQKAATESGILVQTRTPSAGRGEPQTAAVGPDPAAETIPAPSGSSDHKTDFVNRSDSAGPIDTHAVIPVPSPYTLSAGSVIAASLIMGLRSDVPGLVTAQVSEDVFDSATGRILLVPQGARLIGQYDSVVAFGQRRALVVWQRILWPDGSSLQIANVPATDASGYAGLEDKVDFHSWALLKGVALSTLLGTGAQLQFSGNGDLVQAIRQSTQQSVSRAGDQLVSRTLDIQPTITIRPGAPVRLVVHRDLVLQPWGA